MKSEDNGAHAKRKLCGERTSNEVSEPCRLRRGKGYGVCEDEVESEELGVAVVADLCGRGKLDGFCDG